MNRKIKFRIWDSITKEFLKPDGNPCKLSCFYPCEYGDFTVTFQQENTKRFILQQFTGLKDKNNKEIYEEDLVKIFYQDSTPEGRIDKGWSNPKKVTWNNQEYGFRLDEYERLPNRSEEIEVVGNIFENK